MSSLFRPIPGHGRNDTLTAQLLANLFANQNVNQLLALTEHYNDGTHNALEVPKAVALVRWNGATYSLSSNSGSIFSIVRNGVGDITINLNNPPFVGSYCFGQFTASYQDGFAGNPYVATVTPVAVAGTQIRILLHKSASPLGVANNNNWAAADFSFTFALYTQAQPGKALAASLAQVLSGQTLEYTDAVAPDPPGHELNLFIVNQGAMYANLIAGHQPSGTHNALEPARDVAMVAANGTILAGGGGITSVTHGGAGAYTVNLSGYTAPYAPILCAVCDANADPAVAVLSAASGFANGNFGVNTFTYSPANKEWSQADAPFNIEMHAPAFSVGATTYAKNTRRIQDAIFGALSGVNSLATNEQTFYNAYTAEHADWDSNGISGLNGLLRNGQHNTFKVPRAVGLWEVASIGGLNNVIASFLTSTSKRIASVIRPGVGQYVFNQAVGINWWLAAQIFTDSTSLLPCIPAVVGNTLNAWQLSVLGNGNAVYNRIDPIAFNAELLSSA